MYELLYSFVGLALATQCFHLLDASFAKANAEKPYYAVHVLHNIAIVGLTWPDVVASFTGEELSTAWGAIILCYALHLYHIIDYYKVFRYDDWLHHGLMMGIALPLGITVRGGGHQFIGANLFFTTGLPGAVSYGLLFAERNGIMSKSRQKTWNKAVHLWLRAPGCVAQAALSLAAAIRSDSHVAQAAVIAALTAWNGLYFMEQAIQLPNIKTEATREGNLH